MAVDTILHMIATDGGNVRVHLAAVLGTERRKHIQSFVTGVQDLLSLIVVVTYNSS